jgi:serine/threonine protein kinase
MLPSADRLAGLTLDGGWKVLDRLPKRPGATGGFFSKCYVVQNAEGDLAFLKALDISLALRDKNPTLALQALLEAFNFESELLIKCRERRLDRVVTAIGSGTYRFEDAVDGGVVPYLILELAERGDVSSHVRANEQFDLAWVLRSLHHVATGLWQLHNQGIAHQDLKPSNVLVFADETSKVSDLGRASYKGHVSTFEEPEVAGDLSYAPPELLYGHAEPDWTRRRYGCDAYLMGSMVLYFFVGVGATTLLRAELDEPYAWGIWTGTYEEVLPYVRDAFGRVVGTLRQSVPSHLSTETALIVMQLCEPDPRLRGHPRDRNTPNQYSMERYLSRFDLMARRAELGILRA